MKTPPLSEVRPRGRCLMAAIRSRCGGWRRLALMGLASLCRGLSLVAFAPGAPFVLLAGGLIWVGERFEAWSRGGRG